MENSKSLNLPEAPDVVRILIKAALEANSLPLEGNSMSMEELIEEVVCSCKIVKKPCEHYVFYHTVHYRYRVAKRKRLMRMYPNSRVEIYKLKGLQL